jgi:hypothetical protein
VLERRRALERGSRTLMTLKPPDLVGPWPLSLNLAHPQSHLVQMGFLFDLFGAALPKQGFSDRDARYGVRCISLSYH